MGGLDETLVNYGGDEFLTIVRMLQLGYRGARLPGLMFHHQRHTTFGDTKQLLRNVMGLATSLGYEARNTNAENQVIEAILA